jgi:hypothetical protein
MMTVNHIGFNLLWIGQHESLLPRARGLPLASTVANRTDYDRIVQGMAGVDRCGVVEPARWVGRYVDTIDVNRVMDTQMGT